MLRQRRFHDASTTWVNADVVHKHYTCEQTRNKLRRFYKETKNVEGLEQLLCEDKHITQRLELEVFVLAPVGIPLTDLELGTSELIRLRDQLTQTLEALHKQGWVHLDIRASNIVLFEPDTQHSRFFLIDCEYAVNVGQTVPRKRYTTACEGEKAEAKHDFDQLTNMLANLGLKVTDVSIDVEARMAGLKIHDVESKTAY